MQAPLANPRQPYTTGGVDDLPDNVQREFAALLKEQRHEEQMPTQFPLAAGTSVRGYLIESVMSRGLLACVYRARHQKLDSVVVLKEYLPAGLCERQALSVSPSGRGSKAAYAYGQREFLERARRLAKSRQSPATVRCLDFFSANGTSYLVMEHVPGQTLAEMLAANEAQGQPMDGAELLRMARLLLQGIADIHSSGTVHGWLSPDHVLVRRVDGRPVIIGMGREPKIGEAGPPDADGYTAIEQLADGEVGEWTDVYAVGAIMWRMVAGGHSSSVPTDPVPTGKRMQALVRRHPDPLLSATRIGQGRFSDDLLGVIDQCMRLPESERPQNCAEVLRLLPEASEPGSEGPRARRHPANANQPGRGELRNADHPTRPSLSWRNHQLWVTAAVLSGVMALGAMVGSLLGDGESLPPDPTRFARFTIETEPAEARVVLEGIDGEYWPGMFLPDADYLVGISADGYETATVPIQHGTEPTSERIILKPSAPPMEDPLAGFTVEVNPPNARVRFRDFEEPYSAGMRLPEGRYRLEVTAEGYQTELLSVQHGAEPTSEQVSLNRNPAPVARSAFTIELHPANARIRLPDIKARYRPGMMLPTGRYRVEVSSEGYLPLTRTVQHGPGETFEQVALQRPGAQFTVEVEPEGALVTLLDIGEVYMPGMTLPDGDYSVEISAEGFETVVRNVTHGVDPTVERVVLLRLPEIPTTFEFVRVPSGEFTMGSAGSGADDDERPLTQVLINQGFEISKHEVTQGQWEAMMRSNPSIFSACGSTCPVENATWNEVQEYIAKLNSAAGGQRYRLPTEAEWEYAARAGSPDDRYGDLDDIAWWDGNAGFGTHPVGRKLANGFGLHDMLGNVGEWVQDWHGEYPGGSVANPRGKAAGTHKVARGGGWSGEPPDCRVSNRYAARPDTRLSYVGFRLVRVSE